MQTGEMLSSSKEQLNLKMQIKKDQESEPQREASLSETDQAQYPE